MTSPAHLMPVRGWRRLVGELRPRVVILECSAIPDFEYTALHALIQAEERLQARGITLWLTALNPEALEVVLRSPLGRTLGRQRMFFNLRDAVTALRLEAGTPWVRR